jgi:hypothetical protein
MRTKVLLGLAVALMLVVSVATIGSNMGFKISIPLAAFSAGANDGLNWVALPYYNSYADAAAVFADVPGCAEVDLYDPLTQTVRIYDGGFNLDNFAVSTSGQLIDAQAILVKVVANANWVVVGSHSPSMQMTLSAFSAGTNDGLNWRSIPYHTTAADALTLFSQIPNVAELDLYDPTTQTVRIYDGGFNVDNFPITPGVGILIKVTASSSTWAPAHY